MRIIFMGSPAFAVPTLDALVEAGHEIVCVYTQPPRPAGRGKADRPTAVEERARSLGLQVRTPKSLRNEEEQAAFAAFDADVAVVAAYGLILPQAILDAPRHGCLNVHGSLLPRWRGAAPVQRAIMAGDEVTGVTIMQMEAGLDTGPMLTKEALAIGTKNAAQVTEELSQSGARKMVEVLADLAAHPSTPQPEDGATYAAKISKDEARIDWRRPASELVRHIQGLSPFPGAWFQLGDERVKILAADPTEGSGPPGTVLDDQMMIACGVGALRPSRLQRAGKAPLPTSDLLRGYAIPAGTILS
ncbi:methionyl-tRNA formyltransferase [Sphingomonas sp. LY160]|uniref:methionyl-tRNA formyltransferase n=1 Tax=Sphingomonas sp. LY160 TaxID=3095342 RepID=UPI002ADEC396|nr:methionyl-tRNA formyltransferase [Sphingomonas sp. LY160]MEA1071363.1 methionyl-tRNA formyltransferase [Sphingomonas sp. LY160]